MIYVCAGHEMPVDSETAGVHMVGGEKVCTKCFRNYTNNRMKEISGAAFMLAVLVIAIVQGLN